jgi:hypothetical protein
MQKVIGPPAVIVGVGGKELTVIVVLLDASELQPETAFTHVYAPAIDAVYVAFVAPLIVLPLLYH